MPFDPMLFRQVLGRFATGVTVVTTHHSGTKHGMTANAFSSVSLDPPLILVSVDKKANMHELLMTGDTFCVNILAEHRPEWSSWWAGKAPKEVTSLPISHTSPRRRAVQCWMNVWPTLTVKSGRASTLGIIRCLWEKCRRQP